VRQEVEKDCENVSWENMLLKSYNFEVSTTVGTKWVRSLKVKRMMQAEKNTKKISKSTVRAHQSTNRGGRNFVASSAFSRVAYNTSQSVCSNQMSLGVHVAKYFQMNARMTAFPSLIQSVHDRRTDDDSKCPKCPYNAWFSLIERHCLLLSTTTT
jgi:hypothetical protein